MNGYLERLVGRHVEPPAVRPRAVSRFEGDLVGGTVGPEVAAPDARPAAPDAAAQPLGRTGDVSAARQAEPRLARTIDGPAPVSADPHRRAETAAPLPAAGAAPTNRTDGPPDRPPDDGPAGRPVQDAPTVTPVAIRRADPPEVVAPPTVSVTPARLSAGLASPEPDVVHVHIGRIEVRATVPAKETPRPTPRSARPAPLSLEQYLAGERRS